MDKQRFQELFQLATDGDCAAVADLWHEFQFDFYSESAPVVPQASCLPSQKEAVAVPNPSNDQPLTNNSQHEGSM